MSDDPKLFKDHYNRTAAKALAAQVATAWPEFSQQRFVSLATKNLKSLELLARVDHFADALAACLPNDFPKTIEILERSLPAPLADCEILSVGWIQWPIGSYVAKYGGDHFEASVTFLTAFTQRFTAEFAIRPFADLQPAKTFSYLYTLLDHANPHVRRWCSEGVRPRLPWGKRLQRLVHDPAPLWPILEALKDDPELYVRRSVANNLNDIAKDHPELVLARCQKWSEIKTPERRWLIKHALRSLIKSGHPTALALIGFAPPLQITAALATDKQNASRGDSIELIAHLASSAPSPQALLLDYVVHFVRKDGSTGAKTFKWTQLSLAPGQELIARKKHPFKLTSVRKLYAGMHRIELQLNGHILAATSLSLI